MQRLNTVVVLLVVTALAGCDAVRSAPEDEPVPVEEPAETPEQQAMNIVETIDALRGWERADQLDVTQRQSVAGDAEAIPEAVVEEWKWFEAMLFGGETVPLRADDPRWADRVAVDDETSTLEFESDPRDDDGAMAVSMAATMWLEALQLGPLPEVESVDQWLGREIIRRAGPAFVSAEQMARHFGEELTIEELAERPELAAHLPGIGNRLEAIDKVETEAGALEIPEGAEELERAVEQLVLRKALSVAAALYRSGGWPAVEWGRSEPPAASAQVVHPRRWFDGEGATTHQWPEGFEARRNDDGFERVRKGHVGPATTSLWLEGLLGPRAARTIYGGWRGDSYRLYERDGKDGTERIFDWVTTWETPHDAQEMASAAEAVLGHYFGHEHRQHRFRTAAQGVDVAITIHDTDRDPGRLDREAESLTGAGARFLPGTTAPFEFAPTLYDRYVEKTEVSTLDLERETWTDEAAGWQTSIDALEGWTVQRAEEAHVRWFAKNPDNTLIQWTTELVDPMGAEFGSREYLEELKTTFAESMSTEKTPRVEIIDAPAETTIRMDVEGTVDGRPMMLRMWQWRRGDVLVSYSVQGPEAFFGERIDQAEAVLSEMEPHGEAIEGEELDVELAPEDDEGIIEFRIEDEDGADGE